MDNTKLIVRETLKALLAIKARIDGAYDDPNLMQFGPVYPDMTRDIARIVQITIDKLNDLK